jgi:hypothetical protein
MSTVITKREQLSPEEIRILTEEFFAKKFFFSFSSLSKLLYNPATFFDEYVLKLKEIKEDRYLLIGRAIHALLLTENEYRKQFVVMPTNLPSGDAKAVIDAAYEAYNDSVRKTNQGVITLYSYRALMLKKMVELDYWQALKDDKADKNGVVAKTGDDKRMEKMMSAANESYWNYLLVAQGKTVIDEGIDSYARKAVDKIKAIPEYMTLLGLDQSENEGRECFYEQEINYELKHYAFGIKGILDNYVIDHNKKIIHITDVKTIGRELKYFVESLENYNYWAQAIMYKLLVSYKHIDLMSKGYEISFSFLVIDNLLNTYNFKVRSETLKQWEDRFKKEVIFRADYHYKQRQFDLPFEFAEKMVVL